MRLIYLAAILCGFLQNIDGTPISIYDRVLDSLKNDQDGVFDTYTYDRNYCELPIKVGISFSKVDEPYSQFTSNIDMMILTEKIVEIPGDGVITAFECLVNDHTSEAKFGVVKQFSPGRYIIKCITEAKGNDHYPLLMDFVVLDEPCYVEEGDYIAYFHKKQLPNRCIFSTLDNTGADSRIAHVAYDEIMVGDTIPFIEEVRDTVPVFTALFECNCEEKAIGSLLADRPINRDELFDYIDRENVVEAQNYVSGLAIYSEFPGDDNIKIQLISKSTGNLLCGEFFEPTPSSNVGVEEFQYSKPCFLTEDALLHISRTSLGGSYPFSRLSFSKNDTFDCSLVVDGSQQDCDREYSVAAILVCPRSFEVIDNKLRLPTLNKDILKSSEYASCYDDYQYEYKSWNSTSYHENDMFGPTIYIDTKNPLKRGILARWEHHSSEAHEEDFFFPAIFRVSNQSQSIYKIVCWAYQSNNFDSHWRITYPSENCTVQDDDYAGFIYVGNEKVPVSVAKKTQASLGGDKFKSIVDNSVYSSVNIPENNAEYSFESAQIEVQYNIHAVVCYVGFEPFFNDTFQVNDSDAAQELNITNMIVNRTNNLTDAFILIDRLNPIAATGIVHAFTAQVTECNEYSFLMMMIRPDGSGGHDIVCDRYVDGCNYYPEFTYPIDERCIVQQGDLLAVASLDNGELPVPYHLVDNYPCDFADLFLVPTSEICERKYSIGYIYERICLVKTLGNIIIDRPNLILTNGGGSTVFTYVDASTILEDGIIGKYNIRVEAPFHKIEFLVVNYEVNKDLRNLQVICREEVEFQPHMIGRFEYIPANNCTTNSDYKLAITVHGGGHSFGFSCDDNYVSDLLGVNDNSHLTTIAEKCRENARMSLSVTMQCKDDIDNVQELSTENNETTIKEYETPKDQGVVYCTDSATKQSFGLLNNDPNIFDKGKMMFLDKSTVLEDGFLLEWMISVSNPDSPLVPIVWRQRSGNQYEIACYGYTNDSQQSIGSFETITPEGTCKVKKGDHLGFLSLALDDETMRIAGEDNPNADCLMLDPSEIDSLNFITNAIVTLSRSNCDPRRTYSLNAIVCLTEEGDCPDRRIITAGADINQDYILESSKPLAHVNVNESLPRGDLISWEVRVDDPTIPIFPVVWKMLNGTSYQIVCTTFDNDYYAELGLAQIYPRESCFIDSNDYYVGFIDQLDGSRISFSEHSDQILGKTMMDLPRFPIIEGEVVHITSLETHPLLNELIYLDTIPSYSDERLYDIRAKICNLDEICDGDANIVVNDSSIFDQIVITNEVKPGIITKVTLKMSSSGDAKILFLGKDANGQTHLIHSHNISHNTSLDQLYTFEFDPPISMGYPTNYIALDLGPSNPPPVFMSTAEDNPVQLTVPTCYIIDEDKQVPLINNDQPVGIYPLSYCSVEQQVIGGWDANFDEKLKFVYKGSSDYFVVTNDALKTYVGPNGEISEFAAEFFEAGPVTFAVLEPLGYNQSMERYGFKIVDTRTFDSTRSGVVKFSSSTDPLKNIKEGSYLGVIMRKPIVPVGYTNETRNDFGYIGTAADGFETPLTIYMEYGPITPFITGRIKIQSN